MIMRLLSRKHSHPVAIDFGTESIKIIECQNKNTIRFHAFPAPESESARWMKIRDLFIAENLLHRNVFFSIADENTELHEFTLAEIPAKEIPGAVAWELKKICESPDTMAYDWLDFVKANTHRIQITLSPKETVKNLFDQARNVEALPRVLEPHSSALWRTVRLLFPKQDKTFAIIDLGSSAFRLVLADRGRIHIKRTLHFGLANFFQRVRNELYLEPPDTEVVLQEAEPANLTPAHIQVNRILGEFLYTLCEELLRSETFVSQRDAISVFETVYLCGGGACFGLSTKYLEKHLGREVRILNPIEKSRTTQTIPLSSGPLWAGAWGLSRYETD